MALYPVDPNRLKTTVEEQSLWFTGEGCDVFILFSKNTVHYFEISLRGEHIEGGRMRPLRVGKTDEVERIDGYKQSRLVDIHEELNHDLLREAADNVQFCMGLEVAIKDGILEYLLSEGKEREKLESTQGYESYRAVKKQRVDYLKLLYTHRRKIFLGTFLLALTLTILKIYTHDYEGDCKNGDVNACRLLSWVNIITKKKGDAKKWDQELIKVSRSNLISACDNKDYDACLELADIEKRSTQYKNNIMLKACDAGVGKHCYLLGNNHISSGLIKASTEYFSRGCRLKIKEACKRRSIVLGVIEFDHECSANENGESCFKVGKFEEEHQLLVRSRGHYNQGCKFGHGESCFTLGKIMAQEGLKEKAKEFLIKSCDMKFRDGCFFKKTIALKDDQQKKELMKAKKLCDKGVEEKCWVYNQ